MATLAVIFAILFAGVCGQNDDIGGRVVGGAPAPEGAYPYMVSLRTTSNSHFCGASILSNRRILTAAHCVNNMQAEEIQAVVGTNKLDTGGRKYSIREIIIHEAYNNQTHVNDIALLKTTRRIRFNRRVRTVGRRRRYARGGLRCVLTGWGLLRKDGAVPNELQYINLDTISHSNCSQRFTNIYSIVNNQLCTFTNEGEGACFGDSGGPLVCSGGQAGITSMVVPCAVGYPDIFARVSTFNRWIRRHMRR